MTQLADINRFRDIIASRLGLYFEDGRLDQLADVLRQRTAATHAGSSAAYIERFASGHGQEKERRALAESLTVVETFFFRNADNFRAFTERVLPAVTAANAQTRKLHILSAGCASGEEPYSVAMQILEALPDARCWDITITAVDVNAAMLAKALRGRYSAWSLRATPDHLRRRYFREEGRDWLLDAGIRRMVTFEERNLVDDDAVFWSERFDVVFCRNVVMYFSLDLMHRVVRRIGDSLRPEGFLFLGHAETLRGMSSGFHLCHSHDTFYYRRRDDMPVAPADMGAVVAAPVPAVLPMLEISVPWVDVIQMSFERIAALGTEAPSRVGDEWLAAGPAARWDLAPVLEAIRLERVTEALALLSALPSESHVDPDAMLLRAALLTNAGQLDEAEAACSAILALDELNAGAHYLTALCREHAGDAAGAAEHDRIALYLDASFAMPRLHLGLAARRAGDAVAAERELRQALVLLGREDPSRILLFGGGFSRETLLQLCGAELRALECGA